MEDVKKKFKNPEKEFRAAPFWSWNDKLSSEELISQAKAFKEQGILGFFMHSRVGLETEYMGEEWLKCVEDVVKAASQEGMDPWLYDEDRWPSGFAGGKVAEKIGDEGRVKVLVLSILRDKVEIKGDELACYIANLNEDRISNIEKVKEVKEILVPEGKVALILRRVIGPKSDWYNGDSYSDNLNPKSVKAFLETTHDVYFERLKDSFGKVVKGIFTDEPNIFPFLWNEGPSGDYILPWTDIFPAYFKDKRGYDFFDVAPFVFFHGEKSIKARYDFWRTISELYVESYTKQISEWCKEHNLLFTGHYLEEDNFPHTILCSGSVMPHYEYMDIPGVDILTESRYEFLTVKQASSVANQLGKKRVISETYGCTGWEFTFEGQKHVGDWQYALGVNLRCQHLFLYSLRGCRKRDYPPFFNYNSAWKYQKIVEDYFARLSYILTLGKPVRDILLLHPIESSWCEFNGKDKSIPQERGEEFQRIVKAFLGRHYDFDLGDESIIERYGKVDTERKEFVVGEARYKLVILPPMLTIRKSTLSLLMEFLENGGKIIILGPTLECVDGEENKDLIEKLLDHENTISLTGSRALMESIEEVIPRRIAIKDIAGQETEQFLYMEREYDGKKIFFIVINDREREYEVNIYLLGEGRIEEWDLLSGEVRNQFSLATEEYQHLRTKFGPSESKLFVMYPNEMGSIERPKRSKVALYLHPTFEFKRESPNVLVLDKCQYRFMDEDWSNTSPIWIAQRNIREKLGMINIDLNNGVQRWKWVNIPHPKDNTKVELHLSFVVSDMPEKEVYLVTENIKDFSKIILNGKEIPIEEKGWFIDRAFKKILLDNLILGENELLFECHYKNATELEDMFIIGDFGVSMEREITKEKNKLYLGDWCLQGYPYYGGSITYSQKIEIGKPKSEKIFLSLEDYSAAFIRVLVNGKEAGFIPWKYYKLDITDFLKDGENVIELELVGSLRNIFGPLHHRERRIPFVSANSFRPNEYEYTDDYVIYPYGIFSPVKLEVIG